MRIGLFTKLSIGLSLILLVSMSTLGFLLLREQQEQLIVDRSERAIGQVKTLANGSLDALITKDYELLERWVVSVMPADYYSYAFLSSPAGIILTHTDQSLIGTPSRTRGSDALIKLETHYHSNPVNEVIYPVTVGNKTIAYAHLAWSEDDIVLLNRDTFITILGVMSIFLLILVPASFWIVKYYASPLMKLTDAITATSLGSACNEALDKSLTSRSDEIGRLSREYQSMTNRLRDAWKELQGEEQRLRIMVDKRTKALRHTNAELESFSYSVSHDLRAPLRSIDGFSLALIEECASKLNTTELEYLRRVRNATQRMSVLIDSLLALSRIGRNALSLSTTNLSLLATKICENLKESDPDRQISCKITNDIAASCDPNMLTIVLENLLDNAWKYSSKADNATIEFGCKHIDNETVYYVSDNGAGFDMKNAGKLFGTFQRMHTEDEFEGIGIGLATVQRIIHRHKGRIWAEAEVNKGATFFFTLGEEISGHEKH